MVLTGATDGGPLLVIPAEDVTAEWVNFLVTHGRGLLGIAITMRRAAELGLTLQPRRNCSRNVPLYTHSIEGAVGIGTGISVKERAATILAAASPTPITKAVVSLGHIFPQVAEPGSAGQADAALRLMALASKSPVAAICSMLGDDGSDIAESELRTRARALGLQVLDVSHLVID